MLRGVALRHDLSAGVRIMTHRSRTPPPTGSAESDRQLTTYEEFLNRYDDVHAEWVDGRVVLLATPSTRHQDLSGFLCSLLRLYAEHHRLGKVLPAPYQMKITARGKISGREPDIVFIATHHLDRLRDLYLDGPADMVVEIISPDSRLRDRQEKLAEYEAAGVREYWLIDPQREQTEFHVRDEGGVYRDAEVKDGVYASTILEGLRLRVDWLWQNPLPPILSVLKEIGQV
jgi:Uma2 family endonuclease